MVDTSNSVKRATAEDLLEIKAVLLRPNEPFQWSSGLWSPIYCDNRLTMAEPAVRRRIAARFEQVLEANGWRPDVVVGTATAGIPHAAWLADRVDRPMAYVRGAAKKHGRQNKIEGRVPAGSRAVVVEDLVSTGGSVLDVVEALQAQDVVVEGVVAIFSYGLKEADQRFKKAGLSCQTLTSFDTLLTVAKERGDLKAEDVETLQKWRTDPHKWSKAVQKNLDTAPGS